MSSHIRIIAVFEDASSGAVLRKMLRDKYEAKWIMLRDEDEDKWINKGGFGNIKKKISGLNKTANTIPVVILTDLDKEECAPKLIEKWLPFYRHNRNLLFRVAVREIESWVLADRDNFANFLGVGNALIPDNVDAIYDPKEYLINLAKKSKKRKLRNDIVKIEGGTAKQGKNYDTPLISFVEASWNPDEAKHNSPSLRRAIKAVENFQPKLADWREDYEFETNSSKSPFIAWSKRTLFNWFITL